MFHLNPMLHVRRCAEGGFLLELRPNQAPLHVVDDAIISCIQSLPESFDRESALASWSAFDEVERFELWDMLENERLIITTKDLESMTALFGEAQRNPFWHHAIGYHLATRDYPFLDMGIRDAAIIDNEIMKRYEAVEDTPSVYQEFGTAKGLKLQMIENILNDDEVIVRYLDVQPLTLILDTAFGERSRYDRVFHHNIRYLEMEKLLKAVPSGGGRHPAEGFIYAKGVSSLADGVYHYSVKLHALERLGSGKEISDLIDQPQERAIYLFVAPLLERAMWRYREPRSWRAVAIDAGHVVGAVTALAKYCGLSAKITTRLDPDACARAFGIDPTQQPILATIRID